MSGLGVIWARLATPSSHRQRRRVGRRLCVLDSSPANTLRGGLEAVRTVRLGAPPSRSMAVRGVEGVVLPLSDSKSQAPSQLRQSCAWFDFDNVRRLEATWSSRSWRWPSEAARLSRLMARGRGNYAAGAWRRPGSGPAPPSHAALSGAPQPSPSGTYPEELDLLFTHVQGLALVEEGTDRASRSGSVQTVCQP